MSAALATSFVTLQTPAQAADWLRARATRLQTDSRKLQAGDAFIAWPGAAHDARKHILSALQQGAAACLAEAQGAQDFDCMQVGALAENQTDKLALYEGLRSAMGPIASAFYGHPSHTVDVIAVTGTNGKTSTAWWLAQALSKANAAGAGMVGTLGIGLFVNGQPQVQTTGLTTPDPALLQHHLRQWADQGVQACVMEASSIGIEEHRLDGTRVHTAVFTNFTQDHLDYHADMQAYWQAKRKLFAWPGLQAAVINIDDAHGKALAAELQGQPLDIWTLSCNADTTARLQALDVRYGATGLEFVVQERDGARVAMQTGLIGHYNVSNLLGVLACLRLRGFSLQQAVDVCADVQPVPGRMQCIVQDGLPLVAVDYAHTPDALEKALQGLRPLAESRGGRLWCVFGCGGDRDPVKRPLMGAVAARLADVPFITSDNPRTEVPASIIAQIRAGVPAGTPTLRENE
ncbi:MAG: UDP-N-acetylmuramoyl-L-alanyl-D-glutamate--2,6-diaminopimelate ligase, partial [Brachymonas sp.]|nr:UDP-N-acetylmuramoyl-L-alanyl-D-glutamate--2,6-diaminopimelate ligase [Brachymonas sp.]